ncbi:hypothetical protein AB0283_33625, partial [Micromonospora vinacea]
QQAREDMERIAASGEDLSAEPDDWGYDEDGHTVDRRGTEAESQPANVSHDDLSTLKIWWVSEDGNATDTPRPGARRVVAGDNRVVYVPDLAKISAQINRAMRTAVSRNPLRVYPAGLRTFTCFKEESEESQQFEASLARLLSRWDLIPEHRPAREGEPGDRTPVPPKLARLHAAAARRAEKG